MNKLTDRQLLREYAEHNSEAAFCELVRRHIGLVYSAALRMVCETHCAEDVTQSVFIALAQSATSLSKHPVLSGWLHCTARNLAAKSVRAEARRIVREQEAAAMNQLLSAQAESPWEHIAPHLDAALEELSEVDRDAVLLRYFEQKSASEMAGVLHISDEAAQKRVSRAVERLREFFARRGITVGAGGLVTLISANAVQSAPMGLMITVSAVALAAAGTSASSAIAATKIIAMTTFQKAFITGAVSVLAGAGIYQAYQARLLRREVNTFQQRQGPLVEQIEHLSQVFDDATNRLAALQYENQRLNSNSVELLKLRGEVGVLRQQTNELAKLREQKAGLHQTSQQEVLTDSQILELVRTKDLDVRLWLEAFFAYAHEHQGQCPETFRQVVSFLPQDVQTRVGPTADQFEILYHGPLDAIQGQDIIVFREKDLWQHIGGKWGRFYGIADGHAQYCSSSDKSATGSFDPYKSEHIIASHSR